MNQILSFEEKGIARNMKGTVKFFAVSIMAFGVIIASQGGYSLAKSSKDKTSGIVSIEDAEKIKPEITFEQNNSRLTINIDGKKELSDVSYVWSNEGIEKKLLNVSGRTNLSNEVEIPKGTNEITVKVIYADTPDFPYQITGKFSSSATKIKLSVVQVEQNMKMKISVEDAKGIEYITYRWNDNQEITEKPSENDNTKMEIITDIPFGQNTLTVTGVNIFGEKSEKTQEVKGTAKPVINASLSEDGKLIIDVTATDNIKNVDLTVNGEAFKLNIADFIEEGYTIEQLNTSPGLYLEANQAGKIIKLTYEHQLESETNEIVVEAQTEYASEKVSGTLVKPNE